MIDYQVPPGIPFKAGLGPSFNIAKAHLNAPFTEGLRKYYEAAGRLAVKTREELNGKPWLLIQGPTRGGKTFLAAAYLMARMAIHEESGKFVNMNILAQDLRESLDLKLSAEVLRNLKLPASLVLDDLAAVRPSGFLLEALYNVLDSRLEKVTIITADVRLESLERDLAPELQAPWNRLYRRISEKSNKMVIVNS